MRYGTVVGGRYSTGIMVLLYRERYVLVTLETSYYYLKEFRQTETHDF
jgi:hypothetical protein